jgi:protein TonB
MRYSDPKADIKAQFPRASKKSAVVSLLLVLLLFLTCVEVSTREGKKAEYQVAIKVEDIPITKQEIKKEESARPKIATPIAAEKEEVSDTVTIAETDLAPAQQYVPPPPPQEAEIIDFYAVEKPPQILQQVQPQYPELARKAGQEGAVIVEVVIGTNGEVDTAYVVQSRPKGVFDDVAVQAAYKWKFSPAFQRDKPVRVRMQIPFRFTLTE